MADDHDTFFDVSPHRNHVDPSKQDERLKRALEQVDALDREDGEPKRITKKGAASSEVEKVKETVTARCITDEKAKAVLGPKPEVQKKVEESKLTTSEEGEKKKGEKKDGQQIRWNCDLEDEFEEEEVLDLKDNILAEVERGPDDGLLPVTWTKTLQTSTTREEFCYRVQVSSGVAEVEVYGRRGKVVILED